MSTWSALVVTAYPDDGDFDAAGEATLAAVCPDARNPHAFPELLDDEGLEPWSVAELWLIESPANLHDQVVDVTETFDRKLAALRAQGLPDGRLTKAFQVVAMP